MSRWWLRRSLRFRITSMAATITLVFLLGLALLAGRGIEPMVVDSTDEELRGALTTAGPRVGAGAAVPESLTVRIMVLDTAGAPVDGAPAVLGESAVRTLKSGGAVETGAGELGPPVRWLGEVVTAPDGSQRLVVAGMALPDAGAASGARWLVVAALIGAALAGVATWLVVRSALRPVSRMRRSVRLLPAGELLPLPQAQDEVRLLAEDFNALLARQAEVSSRLRRFTGDAAHELRSPVASIRVQAEVAVANPDPELAQETLADVLAEAERLSVLLDGLLALARADAGELPPAEPVELVTEARAAVARLPADAPRTRVTAAVPQAWAQASPTEVELVLNNLLRNASRYAEGQIVVSVLSSRSRVRVVIDDDGPGILPEHRARVFDRFYRVADDRARSSGGAGLGLALVAEAVRRRGGTVSVGESPEGGARVLVSWRSARG